jgi:hypothetical protein
MPPTWNAGILEKWAKMDIVFNDPVLHHSIVSLFFAFGG